MSYIDKLKVGNTLYDIRCEVDTTLTQSGVPADAMATGDNFLTLGQYVKSINLFDGQFTDYSNLEANGTLTPHQSRGVTNYIDVDAETTYYVWIGNNQVEVNYVRCLQYDSSGNIISSSTSTNSHSFTTSSNTKKVRLGVARDYLNNNFEINKNNTAGTYSPYFAPYYVPYVDQSYVTNALNNIESESVKVLKSPKNIFDGTFTDGYNLENDGTLTEHSGRGVSDYVAVQASKTYYTYIGRTQVSVAYVRCLQYDREKNLISGSATVNTNIITTLQNTAYIRVCTATDYFNNYFAVCTYSTAGTYTEYFEPYYADVALAEDIGADVEDYININDSYLMMDSLNTIETIDQLPDYWVSYLQERVQTIRDYLKNGLDLSVFMVVTDTHYTGTAPMNIVSAVPKYVAVNLNVPRLLHLGDIINSGGTLETNRSRAINAMRKLRHAFKEVLPVRGNHDDNGYQSDFNNVFAQTDFFSLVYRGMDVVFGGDGSYFYKDDPNEKTRYIGLNAVDNIYEQSSGGGLLEKHNAFGFAQMEWLCETLLSTPNGYSLIIFDHTMLSDSIVTQEHPTTSPQTFSLNYKVINDILYAYKTRSSLDNYVVTCDFSQNYASYYSGTLNYDFSDCDGTIVGVWSGHEHVDTINTLKTSSGVDTGIYNIETQNSGFMFDPSVVSYPYQATMTPGTVTEYVYDVVVVNRKSKHVDLLRIGAGNTDHRQFDY